MTSTPFNIGLSDSNRSSSRVLRPPGGGHTDIFGGEPEQPRGKRAGPPQTDSFQEAKAQEKAASLAAAQQNGDSAPPPQPEQAQQAPEPIQEKPEPKAEPKAEAPKPMSEPPKRVRVPPGGFSSGLW